MQTGKFSIRNLGQSGTVRFAAGAAAISLLVFAYYARTWGSFAGFQTALGSCTSPFCDFTTYYYPMGEAIFSTNLPIQGFVYSPFIAILLAIFPALGLQVSLILWGVLQAFSILLFLHLFRRLVPAGLPFQLLFVALALTSFPLLHNLTWGQVGVYTTIAILGMLLLLQRNRRLAAAALFAFAVSFKFFPIIFIFPFIVRWEKRFLLLAAAACALFLILVPVVLLGGADTLDFYAGLLEAYKASEWMVTNSGSQHFPHVVLRLLETVRIYGRAYLPYLSILSFAFAGINLGLVYLVQKARLPRASLWSIHILFLTIPFVLKTSWPVDLIYLPFAQTLLVWQIISRAPLTQANEGEGDHAGKAARRTWSPSRRSTAMLVLLLVSILISNIVFYNFVGGGGGFYAAGFIFFADLLLLLITYAVLLPPILHQLRTARG